MAGFLDRRDHVFDLGLLNTHDDRGVARLEEPALRVKARDAVLLVGQGVDKRAGVLRMDDRDHELHPAGTIPSRASYAGAPSSASTSRRMSPATAASSRSAAMTTKRRGSAAARRR